MVQSKSSHQHNTNVKKSQKSKSQIKLSKQTKKTDEIPTVCSNPTQKITCSAPPVPAKRSQNIKKSSMKTPMQLPVGTLLQGRYEVVHSLAVGGFSQTYLAVDRLIPSYPRCVIKQFLPQFQNNKSVSIARRFFAAEAEILAKLDHPHIPKLLAYFEENKCFYLVQELVNGRDLATEFEVRKPYSESEVKDLLKECLQILSYLHQQKIIHRDIKPANIIRDQQGKLHIIDLGAVKQLQNNQDNAFTVTIGTPIYMPPEQAKGLPKLGSDLYALGVVAIEALSGMRIEDIPTSCINGELMWRNNVQASPEFCDVLTRMVRHDFRQRYHNAQEAFLALRALDYPKTTLDTLQIVDKRIRTSDLVEHNWGLWWQKKSPLKKVALSAVVAGVGGLSMLGLSSLGRSPSVNVPADNVIENQVQPQSIVIEVNTVPSPQNTDSESTQFSEDEGKKSGKKLGWYKNGKFDEDKDDDDDDQD